MKSSTKHNINFDISPELVRKLLSNWWLQIFHKAIKQPLRMKDLPKEHRKAILRAILEMEREGFLVKQSINKNAREFEYVLSEKGRKMIPTLKAISEL